MKNQKNQEEMAIQYILIVENGTINRELVTENLLKDGLLVKYANSAEAALYTLVKSNPFLIAIDMILPKLDAHTFSNILKNDENTSGIKIIAFAKNLFTKPIVKPFDSLICTEGKEEILIKGIRNYLATIKPVSTIIFKNTTNEINY